ncbi:calcium-binding protein [Aureimonas sp. SK2]|uniref:beta strand repeat-containing protein n=1 Tax=Aureimonas sp. SK2 TaxID=3015992 RepID=UPI0024447ED4|nr:calcium-binding protein [Aureimonas sp. SK2]
MASLIYNGTTSQTTTYAASDIYTLAIAPGAVTNISQQGANVVIQTGATSLTIAGVTLAQLATGNFAYQGGGVVTFGDGTVDAIADQFGNTLTGTANADILMGLGGGDTINAGNGNNLVFGGSAQTDTADGADQITTGTGNDTIYGNAGNDTIVSGGGADIVFGGIGSDTITANALTGTASVYGGGGFTDTVDGADVINIAGSTGTLFVTGNAGNDTINVTGLSGTSSIYGGVGADSITVAATGGNHLIAGGSSAGNTDADTISFTATGASNVTIFGGVGITDTNDGVDTITVTQTTGSAFIYGNAGNDVITLTTDGTASIYGGTGTDNIVVSSATAATTAAVQIFGGPNAAGTTENISVAGLSAGAASTIYGGTGVNDSADGADSIIGGASNDLIYGNGGNDTIVSGAGNDTLFGGAGDDQFRITGFGTKIVSDYGVGADTLVVNAAQLGVVTSASASTTAVQLTGGTAPNALTLNVTGTLGAQINGRVDATGDGVTADDGNLTIVTSGTAANVIGTANNDFLVGNSGNDTFVTGAGVDTIFGGAGSDTFNYTNLADAGNGTAGGVDFIRDLNLGTAVVGGRVDVIDLATIPTSVANGGVATAAADFDAAFAALAQNEAGLFTIGGQTYLIVDGNGADSTTFTAGDDLVLQVTGVTGTLDVSDFV